MEAALESCILMYIQGFPLIPSHAGHLLRGLRSKNDLACVRSLHSIFISLELSTLAIVGDHLIPLFATSENLFEASLVFCMISEATSRTYHGLISAYARDGDGARSFEMYKGMQNEGMEPDEFTFPCILKACGNQRAIDEGQLIHNRLVTLGIESHDAIGNSLINLYTKCGSPEMAQKVFDALPSPTLVSWSTLIGGYMQHGCNLLALDFFCKMQHAGIKPDMIIFSCILKACCNLGLLGHGKLIYDQIMRSGITLDVVAGNTLVDMYSKCGRLGDACNVFHKLVALNVMSWGTMATGYVQNGQYLLAFKVLEKMQNEGLTPDKVVYLCLVKACGGLQSFLHGKCLHTRLISNGLVSDVVMKNALIDMYARCGKLDEGNEIFENLGYPDAVSWVTIMATHLENGLGSSALGVFKKMQEWNDRPDPASLSCGLKACGQVVALHDGGLIHHQIICGGFDSDLNVGNNLISMYAKCGSLQEAHDVLDRLQCRNVVSWGAIMAGYAQHGHGVSIMEIFEKMLCDNIKPDDFMFSSALKVCAASRSLSEGKWVHRELVLSGLKVDAVINNALVSMYSRCGDLEEAYKVFNNLEKQDIVSWSVMIAGCVFQNNSSLAIHLYSEMEKKGVKVNEVIFSSILRACGLVGATNQGKFIHDKIVRSQLESNVYVESSLINMYVKCECTHEALKLCKDSQNGSAISWGALIAGHAECASTLAMECFEKMELQGVIPEESMYASLLSACGHAGQIDKSYECYISMMKNKDVTLRMKHYNCMADTYARAGYLNEAAELLHSMPMPPDPYGWASFCSASTLHAWEYGPTSQAYHLNVHHDLGE